MEKALKTLNVGSSAVIEVTENAQSQPCQVTIQLNGFSAPPAFYPTPVKEEDEDKKQPTLRKTAAAGDNLKLPNASENSSNLAWKASTSKLWLACATALKTRGSSLFNSTQHNGVSDSTRIAAAFACYSRALQLVTLISATIGLARQTQELEKETCEITFGSTEGDYTDLDVLSSMESELVDLDSDLIQKMHFSLLSNMALCQLKVDCPSYAAKLCTKALELAPRDSSLRVDNQGKKESEEDQEKEEGGEEQEKEKRIGIREVEKVLYRRALAYLQMEEFEMGIEDAENLLQLNPSSHVGETILRDLQAALHAHNATMAKLMKKAFQ